jgi:hypothetical protein
MLSKGENAAVSSIPQMYAPTDASRVVAPTRVWYDPRRFADNAVSINVACRPEQKVTGTEIPLLLY